MRVLGLQKLDATLSKGSRSAILGIALLFAVAVGVADHYLAQDLLILYLVPLYMAAWYGGHRSGIMVAIYAAGASFVTQTLVGASQTLDSVGITNMVIRLLAFIAIVVVVARLRISRRQQQDLVGFIVHDLRSPISSAITGLMTVEQSAPDLDDLSREMVQLALVSNERALGLVNSILDVAKLESGKMEVNKVQTSPEPIVEAATKPVQLWAQTNGIEIRTELEVESVVADPELTSRIIGNLLGNALKFSPEGSAVTVKVQSDPHGVLFSVIDQGPGIPPEFLDSIFEPFAQVKGTKGGTGLGLTFCQLAVQAQGGRIGVKSTLGEGATFWFSLPLS